MFLKNITLFVCLVLPCTFATASTSEKCAAAASQYRYYAEGYKAGGLWVPGSKISPEGYGNKAEGAIFDYYTMHQYYEGTAMMPPELTQFLINTAYKSYLAEHSISFGQAYIIGSCLGVITQDVEQVYKCDQYAPDIDHLDLNSFFQCTNSLK